MLGDGGGGLNVTERGQNVETNEKGVKRRGGEREVDGEEKVQDIDKCPPK